MISIIAGKYKGRKLTQVPDTFIRPTQAKVRKSVFQILEPFQGLKILDLYAGVGTLGIEALSRGAEKVVFVENNRRVFKALEKNAGFFKGEKIKLHLTDVELFLTRNMENYDIIFADPPYAKVNYSDLKIKVADKLIRGGIFCMEMKRETLNDENIRIKNYGSTQVVFWQRAEA